MKSPNPEKVNEQVAENSNDKAGDGGQGEGPGLDFIRKIIVDDLKTGKHKGIVTRFPPEPNGYLHIGHAKSICLNFGVAQEYDGVCHMRFDDTNPAKEEVEYVDSILNDVKWLGFGWGEHLYYASDYFEKLYGYAEQLIQEGKAYVDSLTPEEMREHRGTLTEPGRESPYRSRSVAENLDLFRRMRAGEFEDGAHVLRVKIDMTSSNINMRDPAIYRIRRAHHHRTGDTWCIYPMYDYTHCISDALERITHSLCTLEFEDHRPLYDWVLDELRTECHPQQIEFAKLKLTYTIMSKRNLRALVEGGHVRGWDDPRMCTLSGLRRRGYTPESIRSLCDMVGISKSNSVVDYSMLEHCIREDLNKRAGRVMAVLRPLKLVITNYPAGQVEEFEAENNPEDPAAGTRKVPFSGTLYIEQDDFAENPPPKYFRLAPGKEVRLKHAYYVTCTEVVKDDQGQVTEVHCTYDPESKGGGTPDGRRVKGTLHWVSADHAVDAEVRIYDHLLLNPNPDEVKDFLGSLNTNSLQLLTGCKVEPSLGDAKPGTRYQFLRQGYFCVDADAAPGKPVFNRTVSLKDTWAKEQRKN